MASPIQSIEEARFLYSRSWHSLQRGNIPEAASAAHQIEHEKIAVEAFYNIITYCFRQPDLRPNSMERAVLIIDDIVGEIRNPMIRASVEIQASICWRIYMPNAANIDLFIDSIDRSRRMISAYHANAIFNRFEEADRYLPHLRELAEGRELRAEHLRIQAILQRTLQEAQQS